MEANGYGADLEFDGVAVTIRAGKVAAKIQGTDAVRIPVEDIDHADWRAANSLVNGSVSFILKAGHAKPADLRSYGAAPNNRVNPQSLVVHWRKKDNAAFEAIREALAQAIVPTAPRTSERAPQSVDSRLHLLGGPGWEDLEVAGESYHNREIGRLFQAWSLPEGGVTMRVAALVPEPTNRYDKNAVKVLIDGAHVGYVAAEDAPRIKAQCARVPRGKVAACAVRIWAKSADGTWPARVTLAFSGSSEPERDFAAEDALRREAERRDQAMRAAGKVRGAWWGQHRGAIAELKREGRFEEALALVDECAAAAERAAAAVDERPDPWPVEQQSIIARKLKDPARELAALERYAHACGSFDVPDSIGERLNRARVVAGYMGEHESKAQVEASVKATPDPVVESAPRPVEPPAPSLPLAAWYPDPANPGIVRWWDGQRWTEHTAPRT